MFSADIGDLLSVWTELRNFLNARGAGLQQYSSRRIVLRLAHGLYAEAEDRTAAIELANHIIAAGRRVRPDPSEAGASVTTIDALSTSGHEGFFEERTAHNVAMRLKDNEKKFSGDLSEC